MKKRGQILGLPLVLLFSLIVGAFILLYGAKVILDLTSEADYVEFLDQVKDFDTTVQTFQNYDVGSSKVYSFDLPKDIETLCLYDATQEGSCTLNGESCPADLQGELDLVLDDKYNFYIFPVGLYDQNRLPIEDFQTLGGNPVCLSNGGSVAIQAQKDSVGVSYYEK